MTKKRVFISFDYDYDVTLKNFLVGQSKLSDSPFELSDWSIKAHIDNNWKDNARYRIRSSDVVCIICGEHTNNATGVNAELKITQEEGKSYFLLQGYNNKTCFKPKSALPDDKIYNWTWNNLKLLINGSR
ncbi:TIR domain-containing protein [Morganella morganii]|nr:TIR domain-containing protein [Morganella morganii]